MPWILMEKLIKQLKGFFVLCLTSVFLFFFNIMHFKKYQEDKKGCFPSKTKQKTANQMRKGPK